MLHRRLISTVSAAEIAHFSKLSSQWWNPNGEFGLLHKMNKSRSQFLAHRLSASTLPGDGLLENKSVLDVGCGGGLFSECLARLGGTVRGIDASESNIKIASLHASQDPKLSNLTYTHCAAEDLVEEGKQFDVVCSMEVVEHVDDPQGFLRCLGRLTKPGGYIILSTISRTPLAKLLTITLAEHPLFGFVSPGTHNYPKYLKPSELTSFFVKDLKYHDVETRGVIYHPLKSDWVLQEKGKGREMVNYFFGARKPDERELVVR